ncbi:hypothetical protein DW228_06350 [Bacteroides fragilis]|uniref:Uncharacterized protein n=1 Tax=Bacteroides fragilis TaxID=817 RepID=A0A396C1F8_BACFG|nr:hypothetical protein [Bacteroides fragilis]RHH14418.1 hypothetical protein DW228_06350 [Bacteroides fragilis]
MKAKVYHYGTYPRNNQVIVHNIELEQLAENVYCYVVEKHSCASEDWLGIVLYIGGEFYDIDHTVRHSISRPENLELAIKCVADYEGFVTSKMQDGKNISLMDMKVFENLGIDTTPLIRYREQREAARIAKNEERKKKEEEEKQHKIEQEKQRLAEARQDYKAGNEIDGEDFVAICREDNLHIHIRTVGTLYKSVYSLNKEGTLGLRVQRGKAKPKTDGVRKLIAEYNSFLESKDGQETKV